VEPFTALIFFTALAILVAVLEALVTVLEALVTRAGDAFFADFREASFRDAATRVVDLRTAILRLAFAGRFFLTERLFMEPTIASDLTNEQKI
jgi:hypothetical protein